VHIAVNKNRFVRFIEFNATRVPTFYQTLTTEACEDIGPDLVEDEDDL
jgi:hypothetical protein